jgi:hypothetical protein
LGKADVLPGSLRIILPAASGPDIGPIASFGVGFVVGGEGELAELADGDVR